MNRTRRLDLQAKIILTLVAVVLPTFLVVTIAENQLTRPILEEEVKQMGLSTAKSLATEIIGQKLLTLPNATDRIESYIQELIYPQPNIVRMDVLIKDPVTGLARTVASNVEEETGVGPPVSGLVETPAAEFSYDEQGIGQWEIRVPIEQKKRDGTGKRLLGSVYLLVSMKFMDHVARTMWRVSAIAAAVSVVVLIVTLSFFLRKTIANDRLLRQAESENVQLTERLHEAQRQVMNTEKLAVMGQLTASFAHEIGTPLNAIGGHLQLLQEELRGPEEVRRLGIIQGQVSKIEKIVKGFLQSTAKPVSQRQLVDVNRLVDQTLGIVNPRIDAIGVELGRRFDRSMGPIRAVPVDIEQILLNLVTNSLDSLKSKADGRRARSHLEVTTRRSSERGRDWALISVYDTGEGIPRSDLQKVMKPFFTTKRPGEGTGLGLTISMELARKYGGALDIESREGSWTRVTLKLPYQAEA